MASPPHNGGDDGPSRAGYIVAILAAALGHAALFAFVIFIAPRLFAEVEQPPPAYTVKIVDNIPAGDLGTHLPRLSASKPEKAEAPKPEEPKPEEAKPPEPKPAPDDDPNAIALNTKKPEPTPTETPEPTPEPTPE
ncbi:MAG: hypothetical protein WBG26_06465, partial [Candidatus Binataceae bacterium]